MSRRVTARRKVRLSSWLKPGSVVLIVSLLLVASGASLSWLGAGRGGRGTTSPDPAAQSGSAPLNLAKEYVYVGGRLVATEEPTGGGGAAPVALLASTYAATPTAVTVTWTTAGGAVANYEVERRVSLSDANPYLFTCAATPCDDTSAAPSKAYLYRVRAVFAGGGKSDYSNIDLTTTFQFGDDPLNQGGQKTAVRSSHFTELRDAVNAVRDAAGLPPFSWTEDAPQSGGRVRASHYNDLRTNLREALEMLGMPLPQSAPTGLGGPVSNAPVQELRDLMR